MIDSFIITIEEKKIKFKSDHHRELFDRFVEQFDDGKYRLEITTTKSQRSAQQNRYYWMYLGVIQRDVDDSYTTEQLHRLFGGLFLSKGIVELFGKKIHDIKSTTKLTKGEFMEYLINIQEFTEVQLPDTTEFFGFSYHK